MLLPEAQLEVELEPFAGSAVVWPAVVGLEKAFEPVAAAEKEADQPVVEVVEVEPHYRLVVAEAVLVVVERVE